MRHIDRKTKGGGIMKECIDFESVIPEYLDGELEASLCREFEAHIEECPSCKKALEEMRSLISDISESAVDVPAELKEQVMSRIAQENSAKKKKKLIRILGGAAACLAVAVGVTSVLPRVGSNMFDLTNTESDMKGAPEAEAPIIENLTGGSPGDYDGAEQDAVCDELYESFFEKEDLAEKNDDGYVGSISDGSPLADSMDGDDFEYNAGSSASSNSSDPAEKPSGDTEAAASEPNKGSEVVVEGVVTTYSSYREDVTDVDYGALFMTRGAASLAELLEEEE